MTAVSRSAPSGGRLLRLAAPLLLCVGLIASCSPPPGEEAVTIRTVQPGGFTGSVQQVGKNLIGEDCRLQPHPRSTDTLPILRGFRIYCADWQQESGVLYETAAASNATTQLAELAVNGWWRQSLDARMDCGSPRDLTILDGTRVALLDCSLHGGGWPYLALVAQIGERLYLAEGIPAALPPIETSIAGLTTSFGQASAATPRSAAILDVEARLAGRLYGTGDIQDYRNLLEVASYYNANKEFAKAEERYREALTLHERLLGRDNAGRGYPLMHLALQLSNQERFDLADSLFRQTEALLLGDNRREQARLTSYRAIHAANRREHEEAYRLAERSTEERAALVAQAPPPIHAQASLFQEEAARPDRAELPNTRRGAMADEAASRYITAAAAVRLSRLDDARSSLQEAMRLVRELSRSGDWLYPSLLMLDAEISTIRNDYPAAAASIREAIAAQRRLALHTRDEALAGVTLGSVLLKAGREDEALAAFDEAFEIVPATGRGLDFRYVEPYLQALYDRARGGEEDPELLYRRMFNASQLIVGSVTAQSIARTAARFAAADPARRAVVREWEDARRELERATRRADTVRDDPEVPQDLRERVEARFAAAVQDEAEKDRALLLAFPEYQQLVDKPVHAAEVQAALQPDEALVSIVLGDPASFVFWVRSSGVSVHRADISMAGAAAAVAHLRQPFDDQQALPPFDVGAAHGLYRTLLAPFDAELEGVRHLVTVPSGPLLSLPLGVLVTAPHPPVGTDYDYSRVRFLATRSALSLSPAVAAFVKLRTQAKPSAASRPFVGFGDALPLTDGRDLLARSGLPESCRDDVRSLMALPRLAGTGPELTAVTSALAANGAAVHLRESFTEARIRDLPLNDYRVLYFASHGLLPRELHCFVEPGLVTSLAANAPAGDNGILEASEVRELSLDAELVVLSACNTGGGGAANGAHDGSGGGESLAGLARAFFAAGARSLLASHWVVDDAATTLLMGNTFRTAAAGGSDLAQSLRNSAEAMIASVELSHPWYWGAFTLVGDGGRPLTLLASAGR